MLTPTNDKKTWNNLVIKNGGSLLQSWEWGDLQKKLGCGINRYVFTNGPTESPALLASLIIRPLPLGFSYCYAPYGPILINPDRGAFKSFLRECVDTAQNTAQNKKPVFFRFEPRGHTEEIKPDVLKNLGLKETHPFQPKGTSVIDLTKSEQEILTGMESKTRYAIRAAERRGVKIAVSEGAGVSFHEFWKLLTESSSRKKFSTHPKKYYEDILSQKGDFRAFVVTGTVDEAVISAALIAFFGPVATYLYAASKPDYGKFNAPTLILWEAIREAQRRRCAEFDLWGISDENKKWAGFTAFKRSFGGKEVSYLGTWDLVINNPIYLTYQIGKKIKRAL